jgi:hypothetical protein
MQVAPPVSSQLHCHKIDRTEEHWQFLYCKLFESPCPAIGFTLSIRPQFHVPNRHALQNVSMLGVQGVIEIKLDIRIACIANMTRDSKSGITEVN